MQVIFLRTVGSTKPGIIREVADGYALNFLLPKGLAERATPQRLAELAQAAAGAIAQAQYRARAAEALAAALRGKRVVVSAKASSTGTLYAAVSPAQVTSAIRSQLGVLVDVRQVQPIDHLKTTGEHQVRVGSAPLPTVSLTVSIQPER